MSFDFQNIRREGMRWHLLNALDTKQPDGHWHSKLDRLGIDMVEYTIDCQAGIARPQKYWN